MIVEQRVYTLKPGSLPTYYDYYGTHGIEIQKRILGGLIGYFHTEIGCLNEVTHLWAYDSVEDRVRRREQLSRDLGMSAGA